MRGNGGSIFASYPCGNSVKPVYCGGGILIQPYYFTEAPGSPEVRARETTDNPLDESG
jgi:hypothetical protein